MPKASPHRIAVEPSSASSRSSDGKAWFVIALLLLLLLALQWRLWVGASSWAEIAELQERISQRQQENSRLRDDNARLEAEVRALKEGPESLEARARRELGMIREGETFFLVVPPAR